jgi:hypothetical protein
MWLDPQFWAYHFENVFAKQVDVFCGCMVNRVLTSFDRIDAEAEGVANREYARLANQPGSGSEDGGDIAEACQEAGAEYYALMLGVKQALLNVATVGLYHLLEQQLFLFHRRQLLRREEDNKDLYTLCEVKDRLAAADIKIESIRSWSVIKELRLAADAVKHAEGDSADKLRKSRPDLFVCSKARIFLPLAGEDIHVELHDFEQYRKAIVDFWEELGTLIQGAARGRIWN